MLLTYTTKQHETLTSYKCITFYRQPKYQSLETAHAEVAIGFPGSVFDTIKYLNGIALFQYIGYQYNNDSSSLKQSRVSFKTVNCLESLIVLI